MITAMSLKGVKRAEEKVSRRTRESKTQIRNDLFQLLSMRPMSPVLLQGWPNLFLLCFFVFELGITCFDKSCVQIIGNNNLFC